MHLLGLHILDVFLILLYFVIIFWIAIRISKRISNANEYFLADRKMGKFYQFFLNFGASTDSSQAAAVTREIYRQGIAGMWIQYIVLFITPFYWFTGMLFRRARLTTVGDYFTERFESKSLGSAFAIFSLVLTLLGGAMGYLVSAKTFMALTPKDPTTYTAEERLSVEQYSEYNKLKIAFAAEELDDAQKTRYEELQSLNTQGKLSAFVSHTNPTIFYFLYATTVCIYILLGGFEAAAVTDVVQGILMIFFSAILIPFGLIAVGGFTGLHDKVPEHMFWLFGAEAISEYAWYTIAAMALANLVSIVAVTAGMQVSGSAKDEGTARFGLIIGLMFKRLMMILWAMAGLIAIGLYAGQISDPDLAWGHMTRNLLSPGFIGIMMIGVLAASMSTLDAGAMAAAALVVNQLYKPLYPDKPDAHYIKIGRYAVVFTIYGSVFMALIVSNLLELFKYAITAPAIFGAAIWLGFTWRRLTKKAVFAQVAASVIIIAAIPNIFENMDMARSNPSFLVQTVEKRIMVSVKAKTEDVQKGLATKVGERIEKKQLIPSSPILFDRIGREVPEDPNSRMLGYGRFNAELWVLTLFGMDFTNYSKAGLVTARFLFNAIFPFIVLILTSFFTQMNSRKSLDFFYAKLHTPIQPTKEEDTQLVLANAGQMEVLDKDKLFPNTNIEIHKPDKMDYIGFFGTWALVLLVILLLWFVTTIGA